MQKKILALFIAVIFIFPVSIGNAMELPKTIKAHEESYFIQHNDFQTMEDESLITYKGKGYIPLRNATQFLNLSLSLNSGNIYLSNDNKEQRSNLVDGLPKQIKNVEDTFRVNPMIHAYAGLVVENNNYAQPVFSKNAHVKLYPASTTKVMTAILAIEKGNLQDVVRVGNGVNNIPRDSSKAGIKPGDIMTLEQLLYAMMLPSGNDAAVAIAEHISGTEQNFAKLMTQRAKELGALHTNFTNAHGYHHKDLYTTASDIALIVGEVTKHPELLKIAGTPYYKTTYRDKSGKKVTRAWRSTNEMVNPKGVHYFPSIEAGKTGYTHRAQHNLVSIAKNGDHNYVVVLLRGHRTKRYDDTKRLLTGTYAKRTELDSNKKTMTLYPFNHSIYLNDQLLDTQNDVFTKSNTTYISIDLFEQLSPSISTVYLSQTQEPKATINNELLAFEQNTATIQDGRMLVPARSFFEKVGLQLTWDEKTQTVQAFSEDTSITMRINDQDAYVNGTKIQLDVPATVRNGRTLVPIRFATETTGNTVDWGVGRTIYLQ